MGIEASANLLQLFFLLRCHSLACYHSSKLLFFLLQPGHGVIEYLQFISAL